MRRCTAPSVPDRAATSSTPTRCRSPGTRRSRRRRPDRARDPTNCDWRGNVMAKTMRSVVGQALTPAARAWIRYSPLPVGKAWLWDTFHWRPREFTCRTRFGGRISGTTEDLIQRHLYFFGTWEPHISGWIEASLRAGDCFVDVGANIGHYSLLASALVGPGGHVVAIE